jgi:GH24 family phage-related lysozyme (muramidase)
MLTAFLGEYEGRHRTMYLDVNHNVTTGIGIMLETEGEAMAIAWARRDRRAWANQQERQTAARDEYRRIQAGGAPRDSEIVLLPNTITQLFQSYATDSETTLKSVFSEFDQFPADAQLGMLAHTWLRPSAAGIRAWHEGRYMEAINQRNWDEAGQESLWGALIRPTQPRQEARRRAMLRMFHNAALVEEARGQGHSIPVSMLFYPREAGPTIERVAAGGQLAGQTSR